MKEAIIRAGPVVEIIDSPIPRPGKDQVGIRTIFSGSNPKDWKRPEWRGKVAETNQGDDISGVVHEVGENVVEFKKGDRVAALHEMQTIGGSYAEYSVAWKHTVFFLPAKISFQEGAAIPLAALTAAIGLYESLRLPQPWTPAKTRIPLVLYGGSSAVGIYALQFAMKSNIHPMIVIAGRASAYVEQFIDRSKGDVILDYRNGPEALRKSMRDVLNGEKLLYALDGVSVESSSKDISEVLDPHGAVTFVLKPDKFKFPETVNKTSTLVGDVFTRLKDFGLVYSQIMTKGLEDGGLKAQRQEIIPGGLHGVEKGLSQLKDGTASAVKYVFKIEDTPGAGKD